jgi:hypothetical protein
MLSPAIAALAGATLVGLWTDMRAGHWRGWLLPLVLIGSAVLACYIVWTYDWAIWMIPTILVLTLAALGLLAMNRSLPTWVTPLPFALTLCALLFAPAVWTSTVLIGSDSGLPFASPMLVQNGGVRRTSTLPSDSPLLDYLRANQGTSQYLVATLNANTAAPFILQDEVAVALGGFSGGDQIFTGEEVAQLVANHTVRFFYLPTQQSPNNAPVGNGPQRPALQQANSSVAQWVAQNCQVVDSSLWQQAGGQTRQNAGPGGTPQLYDCGGN